MEHFPSLDQDNPDWDHDGYSNLEEYIANTVPTNPASFFRIDSMVNETLFWTAQPGRIYSIYWTDSLSKPFSRIVSGITTNHYTIQRPQKGPAFYRIHVELE